MTTVVRAARYLRVSKAEQDPALEDDETSELISKRGWKLVDTYTDHGISGTREKRPALDRLLQHARRRRVDVIVVWKADRLFRSLKAMVTTLDEWSSDGSDVFGWFGRRGWSSGRSEAQLSQRLDLHQPPWARLVS